MKKIKLIPLFTLLFSCNNYKEDIEGLWSDEKSKHISEIKKIEQNMYTLNVGGGGEIGFGIKKGDTIYWTTIRKNNSVEKSYFNEKGELIFDGDILSKINKEKAEEIINQKIKS